MSRTAVVAVVAALAVVACLQGCQRRTLETVPADRALVDVELRDSSVAPDSHRSWTLLLDAERAVVSVTDYEEVVHEGSEPMPADTWRSVRAALADETRVGAVSPDECAGGMTMTITTYESSAPGDVARAGADRLDELVLSSCDRSGAAAIEDVERAVTPAADLVGLPDQARTWSGR